MNIQNLLLTGSFSCLSLLSQAQTHNYANAQHLATRFLGAQRCGNNQSWMHPACHTTDGHAINNSLDLSGGWHDCGDYIKFGEVESESAANMLIGFDFYPEAYADNYSQANSAPPANGIPDVLDEVKIETDYLIKCISGGTVYWQVGGNGDHNDFSTPEVNSSENQALYGNANRPVLSATSGISNICGTSAAALGLMSILYKPYDANYASLCLTKAIEYYTAGKVSPNFKSDPDNFYTMADYEDEMALAAAVLYRATNNTASYKTDLTTYVAANKFKNNTEPDYWGNVKWVALMEAYKATGTSSYLTQVGTHLGSISNSSCGYYYYANGGGSGEFEYTAAEAFLASLYHSASNTASAYTFAKTNVDFMLGTHPQVSKDAKANMSFLIGYNVLGGGYPHSPQHAAALGDIDGINFTLYTKELNSPGSVTYKYICEGALTGGFQTSSCTANGTSYVDNIDNFNTAEVCTGYNAQLIGALAYVNKIENNITTSVEQLNVYSSISVYPNPSETGKITIDIIGEKNIQIINELGQVMQTVYVNRNATIDVSSLNAGMYFITSTDKTIASKLIIK